VRDALCTLVLNGGASKDLGLHVAYIIIFTFSHRKQAQILEFDRQRVAKIAKEYFYIPQVEHTSGSSGAGGSASVVIGSSGSGVGSGSEGVNPAALKTILSDTATIDMLSAQSRINNTNYAANTTSNYHTTTHTNNTNTHSTSPTTTNHDNTLTTHTISSTIAEVDNNADLSDQAVDVLKSNIHSWLVEEATLGRFLNFDGFSFIFLPFLLAA